MLFTQQTERTNSNRSGNKAKHQTAQTKLKAPANLTELVLNEQKAEMLAEGWQEAEVRNRQGQCNHFVDSSP